MRKINKMDVARLVLVLALVAGIGLAFGSVGRFVPTHKIVQPVYCGSCHPEQVIELSETTHLGKFSEEVASFTNKNYSGYGVTSDSARTNARIISGACVMCHNYWENFKWYGVKNFDLTIYDEDVPGIASLEPPTDIYGNAVSPYGLGSTAAYVMNIATDINGLTAEPWMMGLNQYQYTTGSGASATTHSRLDYVWSRLSAVSPGPVGFLRINTTTGAGSSCAGGTVEHGMCHIASSAVALAYMDQKNEISTDLPNGTGQFAGSSSRKGKGIFFAHEMAFTTAQYAAKPVKICGACHIMKLPPMRWGGEPWAIIDINEASANGGIAPEPGDLSDPFGFRPTYNDLTGQAGEGMVKEENYYESLGRTPVGTEDFPVAFRTPDWAHANVPCIRCHAHAGINGDTVSDNTE